MVSEARFKERTSVVAWGTRVQFPLDPARLPGIAHTRWAGGYQLRT